MFVAVGAGLASKQWPLAVMIGVAVLLWNIGNVFLNRSRTRTTIHTEASRLRAQNNLLWLWIHQETTLRNLVRDQIEQLIVLGESHVPPEVLEEWRRALDAALAALNGHESPSSLSQ